MIKKKINLETELIERKTRLDHFLKKESKSNTAKKNFPIIQKKLLLEKNTVGKQKDSTSILPNLIIEKKSKFN